MVNLEKTNSFFEKFKLKNRLKLFLLSGYRRDDQGGRSGDEGGPPQSGYRSGGSYRPSRGGFNNDYYNNRRPDNRVSFFGILL